MGRPKYWPVWLDHATRSQLLAVGNALNLRFWTIDPDGQFHATGVTFRDEHLVGSMYLWRKLALAVEDGIPLHDAKFLKELTVDDFEAIFRDDDGFNPLSPGISDRVENFVTDGIEPALTRAREAAGDGEVSVHGGVSTINQYLTAGLIDELRLHIVPITLGAGTRLFDGVPALKLEQVTSRAASSVTHVTYRVLRRPGRPRRPPTSSSRRLSERTGRSARERPGRPLGPYL
jgi:hypothetical protein